MQISEQKSMEQLLVELDNRELLFPKYKFKKLDNELNLIGKGGFSLVYEMQSKVHEDWRAALKVIGLDNHSISSEEFWTTSKLQTILCQESQSVVKIIAAKELYIELDSSFNIISVEEAVKPLRNMSDERVYLQLILMEKLDTLLIKDKFKKVSLCRPELSTEAEVIRFGVQIGQALAVAHEYKVLHRDVKLENIFWDSRDNCYKLGDFGIAKLSENGSAETIVYTDGYGAPEIEKRMYSHYNAKADIYSFGITLYLLLNDLKFPGSDRYSPRVEIQYNEEFTLPAPLHASQSMTRIIRKMCSFYPEERYSSMAEVVMDLAIASKEQGLKDAEEIMHFADVVTETYNEIFVDDELNTVKVQSRSERRERAARLKAETKIINNNVFIEFTILFFILFRSIPATFKLSIGWIYLIFPMLLFVLSLLQKVKDVHIVFGIVTSAIAAFSVYSCGLTYQAIVVIICAILCIPVLTMSASLAIFLWLFAEISNRFQFLEFFYRFDIVWIIIALLVFKITSVELASSYIMEESDRLLLIKIRIIFSVVILMFIAGVILYFMEQVELITLPVLVGKIHFVRTSVLVAFFFSLVSDDSDDYYDDEMEDMPEE